MTMDILVERADGVLTIAFNRPDKKNAITAAMYQTMADAIGRSAGRRGGPGHPDSRQRRHFQRRQRSRRLHEDAAHGRKRAGVPVPARDQLGGKAGGGVGGGRRRSASARRCCCIAIWSTRPTRRAFSLPFTQLGLCPEAASSLLLQRVAGYQAAAEKLLLGEAFDAAEAQRMGFVNRVLPAAEVDAFAVAQAAKLAALPASSLRVTKRLMKRASQQELQTQMSEEAVHFGKMLLAPEAREAFKAFFEKRKPDFRQFD